jgi:hypothetical protein
MYQIKKFLVLMVIILLQISSIKCPVKLSSKPGERLNILMRWKRAEIVNDRTHQHQHDHDDDDHNSGNNSPHNTDNDEHDENGHGEHTTAAGCETKEQNHPAESSSESKEAADSKKKKKSKTDPAIQRLDATVNFIPTQIAESLERSGAGPAYDRAFGPFFRTLWDSFGPIMRPPAAVSG